MRILALIHQSDWPPSREEADLEPHTWGAAHIRNHPVSTDHFHDAASRCWVTDDTVDLVKT